MVKPYYQDPAVTIYCGDSCEVAPTLPKTDLALATDPPYGISFSSSMGGKFTGNTVPSPLARRHTPEEWRALKRMEWRQVMQAMGRFNCGSYYTPTNEALYEVQKLSQQITEAIEADGWIAW